jgi:hypothetical protein
MYLLVVLRLVARGELDDAQALDPQPDTWGHVGAAPVGPAMLHGGAHPREGSPVDGRSVALDLAGDAAHW